MFTAPVKPRLIGLDVLRFVAIMLVLGAHLEPPPEPWQLGWRSILVIWQCHDARSILWTWQRGGWIGVDLFFVLSGFLISGLLFTEYKSRGTLSVGRFYLRRGWKIYPPFFVLIAATLISNLICGTPAVEFRQLLSELLFLQSYLPGLWGHTWSLAVEEHFYLLLPLALVLMRRLKRNSPTPFQPVLPLAACIAVSALVLRLVNWHNHPNFSNITHLFPSHLRFDSLFFGVAISYVYHFHTRWFVETLTPWRRWLIVGGALLLAPTFIWPLRTTPFIFTAGYTLCYFGSGLLLVGTLLCDVTRNGPIIGARGGDHGPMVGEECAPTSVKNGLLAGASGFDGFLARAAGFMATLGAYSYSIYLWHLAVRLYGVQLIERACGVTPGLSVRAASYVIGSLLLGVLMAKIVELPALRLRNRWFPSLTSGPIEDQPIPLAGTSPSRPPVHGRVRNVPPWIEVVGLLLLVGLPLLFTAGALLMPGSPDRLACGDDGNIELFTWHALHDVQLSSIRTHGNLAEHLGPMYFYLLAPLYGLFGGKYQGLQLGAIAINLLAIGGVLGVARHCGGRTAMLWAALLAVCYARFMSIPWLASVWLPWVVVLPFLATLFLLAAVISGRVYCLPAAVFAASFIVQTQLGYTLVLAAAMLLTLLALVPRLRSWLALERLLPGRTAKAMLIAAAVLAIVWTPPAIKQILGMPGRISETIGYFAAQGADARLGGGGKDARLHAGGVSRFAGGYRSEVPADGRGFRRTGRASRGRPAAGAVAGGPLAVFLSARPATAPRLRRGALPAGHLRDSVLPVLHPPACRRHRVPPRILDDGPGPAGPLRHRQHAAQRTHHADGYVAEYIDTGRHWTDQLGQRVRCRLRLAHRARQGVRPVHA